MDSVSLATPASVAATEKKTMTIESRLELADGCALIVSKRGVDITIDRYGDMHMKPNNNSRRTRRSMSYYINNCLRQAQRSHKHKMEGVVSASDERGGVDRDESGGVVADEFSAIDAAIDAAACLAASEVASASVGVMNAAGETEQQEQQQKAEQTAEIERAAAVAELDKAAAVEAVAIDEEEEAAEVEGAAMEEEAAAVESDSEDDEEEGGVPERHAHDAGVGKRQAVEGAPTSHTPAPRAPRFKKFGLLGERAASSMRARAGIKKNVTEQSTGYTASIYKEIKKDEQQARVQNIFYELRAEGYDANEAAVLALERARGGDEEM